MSVLTCGFCTVEGSCWPSFCLQAGLPSPIYDGSFHLQVTSWGPGGYYDGEGRGVWSLWKKAWALPLRRPQSNSKRSEAGTMVPIRHPGTEDRCCGLHIAPIPDPPQVSQAIGCLLSLISSGSVVCTFAMRLRPGLTARSSGNWLSFSPSALSQGTLSALYSDFHWDWKALVIL